MSETRKNSYDVGSRSRRSVLDVLARFGRDAVAAGEPCECASLPCVRAHASYN